MSRVSRALSWCLLFFGVATWLRFGLLRVQQAVLGEIVLPAMATSALLLTPVILVGLVRMVRDDRIDPKQLPLLLYVVYVAADLSGKTLLMSETGSFSFFLAAGGYFHFVPIAWIGARLLGSRVCGAFRDGSRGLVLLLLWISIPIYALGYAQYFLNDPILEVGYAPEKGKIFVQSHMLVSVDRVRGFSIFGSAYMYGIYLIFVGSLVLAQILAMRPSGLRRVFQVFFMATLLALFTTQTRNVYLGFLLTMFGLVVARRSNTWSQLAVRAFLVSGLGFYVLATVHTLLGGFGGLLDTESLMIRFVRTTHVFHEFGLRASPIKALFGHGLMQETRVGADTELVFDNTFLDIYLYSGLLGLLAFAAVLVQLYKTAYVEFQATRSPAWLALLAVLFSYPLMATFNIYVGVLFVQAVVVAAAVGQDRRHTASKVARSRTSPLGSIP